MTKQDFRELAGEKTTQHARRYFVIFKDRCGGDWNSVVGSYEQAMEEASAYGGEVVEVLPLSVCGKTFKECKADLYAKAVASSYMHVGGLSWGEVSLLQDFFETNGRKYGLLREFRENGII